jgi:hypothetical protein
MMVHCQRRNRLALKMENLIRRTGRLRIPDNYGCSSERGRGESNVRERFRGSRDETEGHSTPVCRVSVSPSVGTQTLWL